MPNLVPACHECNSVYKLSKDPAHNAAGRRKAFYPYTTGAHGSTRDAFLAAVQQQTAKAPVVNSNFLKSAFLEGCQRAGLFDAIATEGAAP